MPRWTHTGKVQWCNDTSGYAGVEYNALLHAGNAHEFPPRRTRRRFRHLRAHAPGAARRRPGRARRTQRLLHPGWFRAQYWKAAVRRASGGQGRTFRDCGRQQDLPFLLPPQRCPGRVRPGLPPRGKTFPFYWGRCRSRPCSPGKHRPGIDHDRGKTSYLTPGGKLVWLRKAYSMALANGTLILQLPPCRRRGGPRLQQGIMVRPGRRRSLGAGRRPWPGLRLHRGDLDCFAPTGESTATPRRRPPSSTIPARPRGTWRCRWPDCAAGMDRGFALVIGDKDGTLTRCLVAHTDLRVVPPGPRRGVRRRVVNVGWKTLTSTAHAFTCRPPARPCTAVFRAIPPTPSSSPALPRALPPKTCIAWSAPAGTPAPSGIECAAAARLLQDTVAPAGEIHAEDVNPYLVRGQLPGALDWNNDLQQPTRPDGRARSGSAAPPRPR